VDHLAGQAALHLLLGPLDDGAVTSLVEDVAGSSLRRSPLGQQLSDHPKEIQLLGEGDGIPSSVSTCPDGGSFSSVTISIRTR